MNAEMPGVVKRISRYARRFSSVDGTPTDLNRFSMVDELSSAARIPLPGGTRDRATDSRSRVVIEGLLLEPRSGVCGLDSGTGRSVARSPNDRGPSAAAGRSPAGPDDADVGKRAVPVPVIEPVSHDPCV